MEINRNNIIDELIEKFNYRKDLKILLNKNDGRYFICINKVAKKFIDVTYEKKEYDKIMNELCKIFNVNEEKYNYIIDNCKYISEKDLDFIIRIITLMRDEYLKKNK